MVPGPSRKPDRLVIPEATADWDEGMKIKKLVEPNATCFPVDWCFTGFRFELPILS